jgi:hypothetical protein
MMTAVKIRFPKQGFLEQLTENLYGKYLYHTKESYQMSVDREVH